MKTILALWLAGLCVVSKGQTNTPYKFTVVTNLVVSQPNFRRVNGKLYNTELSQKWSTGSFGFITRTNNLVIAYEVFYEPIYQENEPARRVRSDSLTRNGNLLGAGSSSVNSAPSASVQIGRNKTIGHRVAITNLLREFDKDEVFTVATMKTGEESFSGKAVDLLDVGILNVAEVLKTNRVLNSKP